MIDTSHLTMIIRWSKKIDMYFRPTHIFSQFLFYANLIGVHFRDKLFIIWNMTCIMKYTRCMFLKTWGNRSLCIVLPDTWDYLPSNKCHLSYTTGSIWRLRKKAIVNKWSLSQLSPQQRSNSNSSSSSSSSSSSGSCIIIIIIIIIIIVFTISVIINVFVIIFMFFVVAVFTAIPN